MDINALPAGEAALVDANIIIYYLGGLSAECRDFFHRVARREVEAHITTTIITETLHRPASSLFAEITFIEQSSYFFQA